jgi:hypothetical protein
MKTLKINITMTVKVPQATNLNDTLLAVHNINLGVYDHSGRRKVRHSIVSNQIGTITFAEIK